MTCVFYFLTSDVNKDSTRKDQDKNKDSIHKKIFKKYQENSSSTTL